MDIVFNPALTKLGHARNAKYREKRYSGTFQRGRLMKFTRKSFKRAFDAECYVTDVMCRYRRLLAVKEREQV